MLSEVIPSCDSEELMAGALTANDELSRALTTFEDLAAQHASRAGGGAAPGGGGGGKSGEGGAASLASKSGADIAAGVHMANGGAGLLAVQVNRLEGCSPGSFVECESITTTCRVGGNA